MRFHLDLADGCKFSMRPTDLGISDDQAKSIIAGEADMHFASEIGAMLHNHADWLRRVAPRSVDMKRNDKDFEEC